MPHSETTPHLVETHGVTMSNSENRASLFNAQLLIRLIACLISAYDIAHITIQAAEIWSATLCSCHLLTHSATHAQVIGGSHSLPDLMNSLLQCD